MKQDLSTFPSFALILKECQGDWEKAQANYFIAVAMWHEDIVSEAKRLLDNAKTELRGITAKMLLQEFLGVNHR